MHCDSCEALMINDVFCHETGCPNTHARYDDGDWIKQYECRECGCIVDSHIGCDCNTFALDENQLS